MEKNVKFRRLFKKNNCNLFILKEKSISKVIQHATYAAVYKYGNCFIHYIFENIHLKRNTFTIKMGFFKYWTSNHLWYFEKKNSVIFVRIYL